MRLSVNNRNVLTVGICDDECPGYISCCSVVGANLCVRPFYSGRHAGQGRHVGLPLRVAFHNVNFIVG